MSKRSLHENENRSKKGAKTLKWNVNQDYVLQVLDMLLKTPSPSGFCGEIMDKLAREADKLGYAMDFTPKGCGIIEVQGRREDRSSACPGTSIRSVPWCDRSKGTALCV